MIYELRFKTCAPFSYADILYLFFPSGSVYVHHPEEDSAPSRKSNVSFRQQGSTNDKVLFQIHLSGFEGPKCYVYRLFFLETKM